MKVVISAACSLDGYIDDCSPERLKLSSDADWAAVQRLRARCDVILVGAGTVRSDNPSLTIKDPALRTERSRGGLAPDIAKATVTSSGELDAKARFFTEGEGAKIVFASAAADPQRLKSLSGCAEVIRGERITAGMIVSELERRGYGSLLVEGGTSILTMFLTEGAVDELRLAVAPFFVGEEGAPRLVGPGGFPWTKENHLKLAGVEILGDTAVMHYTTER